MGFTATFFQLFLLNMLQFAWWKSRAHSAWICISEMKYLNIEYQLTTMRGSCVAADHELLGVQIENLSPKVMLVLSSLVSPGDIHKLNIYWRWQTMQWQQKGHVIIPMPEGVNNLTYHGPAKVQLSDLLGWWTPLPHLVIFFQSSPNLVSFDMAAGKNG